MLKFQEEDGSTFFTFSVWLLMAFQAGYVNVGALVTSGYFVSHVTGTSSRVGIGLADLDLTMLSIFVVVLMAFITGATFSGYHIGRQEDSGREPRYVFVAAFKALIFGLVLIISELDLVFGDMIDRHTLTLSILFLLSFCCGVQNATCAQATGGFLKPTHMTGLSTDLGIAFGKLISGGWRSPDLLDLRTKTTKRVSLLVFFILGGVMSEFIFSRNGHYGFLFPFMSSSCFLFTGLVHHAHFFGPNSWAERTAKGSILVTFLATLVIGVTASLTS